MSQSQFQVLVNILVLAGFVSKGHEVVERSYPVEGSSSYIHLTGQFYEDVGAMTRALHLLGNRLGIDSQALVTNVCGESFLEESKSQDVFFKGQCLYKVSRQTNGVYAVFEKSYGYTFWYPITYYEDK
jgi:hypothetical protein